MYISEPRVKLHKAENDCHTLTIQIDYGKGWENEYALKDEKLYFALCLVKNMNWKPVGNLFKSENIIGFKSINSYSVKVWQTDKQDPIALHSAVLQMLELMIKFNPEKEDAYTATTRQLMWYVDGITVKEKTLR